MSRTTDTDTTSREIGASLVPSRKRTSDVQLRVKRLDPDFTSRAVQRYSYFRRGMYKPQWQQWASHFDRARTLILKASELDRNPRAATNALCAFLQIRSPDVAADFRQPNIGSDSSAAVEVGSTLADRFRDANLVLLDCLGTKFQWLGVAHS